jgi:hypothetical protein
MEGHEEAVAAPNGGTWSRGAWREVEKRCEEEQDALVVHEEGKVNGNLASTMYLVEDKARRWWRTWVRPWEAVGREPWVRQVVRQQCGARGRERCLVSVRG